MCKGICRIPPVCLLIFLTLINVIIYIDRGILASIATTLEDNTRGLGLTSTEIGAIGSFFMVGYMLAGPVFGHYAQSIHALNLIAIGLTIWGIACVGAGFSNSFWQLAIARAVSGAGEASFVSLAPPYILDHAPASRKTTWIALFFSGISLGYSLGYILGHTITQALGGWYWPFFVEAAGIVPFILICLIGKKESPKVNSFDQETPVIISPWGQVKLLSSNLTYSFIVLGFTAYIFTIGGISFWGPYIIEKLYQKSAETAAYTLGIIALGCGIAGTLIGSLLFDCIVRKYTKAYKETKISEEKLKFVTTEKANMFMCVTTAVALGIGVAGILMNSYNYFIVGVGAALFFLFLAKGPVAIALMSSVPTSMRGQANAVAIFFMHLLGDLPSPALIGLSFTWSIYYGTLCAVVWLSWAIVFWVIAWNVSRFHGQDNRFIWKNFCSRVEDPELKNLL